MPVEIMRRFAAGAFRWILIVLLFALVTPPTAQARFLSPDTWDPWLQGVDINRYAYSNNDPINNSDPNGHGFEWLMDQANRDAIAGERIANKSSGGIDPRAERIVDRNRLARCGSGSGKIAAAFGGCGH